MVRGSRLAKSSGLAEVFVGPRSFAAGSGWEEGARRGAAGGAAAPATPHPVPVPRARELAALARRLREEAAQALGRGAAPVTVRASAAEVRWHSGAESDRGGPSPTGRVAGARWVGAATLLVGDDPAAPDWSRTAPLEADRAAEGSGTGPGWPPGWLEAAARDSAALPGAIGRDDRAGAGPSFAAANGRIVADAFAAGDLLRLAVLRGARAGGRGGRRGPVLEGLAPGIRVRARYAPARSPAGSWRSASDPPWEELGLEIGFRAAWPADGFVLTRLLPLRGVLLGAGHLLRGGVAVARWGPVAIPPPGWWLTHLAAALGDPVPDATGPPVGCPPVLVAWGRAAGPR